MNQDRKRRSDLQNGVCKSEAHMMSFQCNFDKLIAY